MGYHLLESNRRKLAFTRPQQDRLCGPFKVVYGNTSEVIELHNFRDSIQTDVISKHINLVTLYFMLMSLTDHRFSNQSQRYQITLSVHHPQCFFK